MSDLGNCSMGGRLLQRDKCQENVSAHRVVKGKVKSKVDDLYRGS